MKAELGPLLGRSAWVRPHFPIVHPSALVLLAFSLLLFCQGISSRTMWASHEARAAQNAQRVLDEENWLLPGLFDGQVELQKPPGFYWLVAGFGWLRGSVDPVGVRLPAVIAGLLMVIMLWWHLHQRGRPVAGFLAGALLASAVHFTGTARIGRIDVPLACVVMTIVLYSRSIPDRRIVHAGVILGILGGMALLLKGPIGLVLPVAVVGSWCLIERVSIWRFALVGLIAVGISLAIALPWYLWANEATEGEFFRVFILYHHMNRAFGGTETLAGHPWWYYVPRFVADFLPWTPLLLIALVQRRWRGDADARLGLIWLAAMVAVLSISRFKRADYLLPAYAGAAIFLGCALDRWYHQCSAVRRRRLQYGLLAMLVLFPVGWLVFDRTVTAREEAARDHSPFAREVRELAPQPVEIVLFRVESHQLAYHLGRPIHTLVEWGDLNARIGKPGPHFVVTRSEFLDEIRTHATSPPSVVASTVDRDSVPLRRPLILLRFPGNPCPTRPKD